jgi:hypothetical protein
VHTVVTQYGWGSGKQQDGTLVHAYPGEHQAFAPDLIFYSAIVGKLDPGAGIGAGLGNKQYLSLQYTYHQWSPLMWIADWIGVPDRDIASAATTLQWHHDHLRSVASGPKRLGDEFDVTFQIETPAGITSQVQAGYFDVGGGLGSLVEKSPWTIAMSVKVKM